MMTTRTVRGKRKQPPRDTTPVTVQVRAGTLVYWDGAQRGGLVDNVPKHVAMEWLKQRFAKVIYEEPVGAGAASNPRRSTGQAVATTAVSSPSESGELRDTSTDPPGHPPLPPGQGRQPHRSVKNGLYASRKFHDLNSIARQRDSFSPVAEPLLGEDSGRTGSVRVRECPNCGKPVSGRRKWCSEACRLQAYRGREYR